MTERSEKRRRFIVTGLIALMCLAFFLVPVGLYFFHDLRSITTRDIEGAEKVFGLGFTARERRLMLKNLEEARGQYRSLRSVPLPNEVPPAVTFSPLLPGMSLPAETRPFTYSEPAGLELPAKEEDIAFLSVVELAHLIRTGKLTSTALTRLYLERLKRYGPKLECVVTLTEELAMEQARRADAEIAAGKYRGPLHGIPWGAKDLLAVKGVRTTWGSAIYKDQVTGYDATVVARLEEAGAVLVAKLSMGELAMGDVWFGGRTRNPWNRSQGSSGSSAGSAAAVSAGLVGFAIGTETLGSIVSPCTRCGATGLRPTFGRVSRHGAMALSWTMDKIGPIARSVEDCALVLKAIAGPDPEDPAVVDAPFNWDRGRELDGLRVGYLKSAFDAESRNRELDRAALDVLKRLGFEPVPVELPELDAGAMDFILDVEAAAAFDTVTRENLDDLMVRQGANAWPNIFRRSRFVPAVEYVQAQRARRLLMREMAEKMSGVDVFVTPSYGGNVLLVTNLTGHPAVVVPNGFDKNGSPVSITFIGGLFREEQALRVARAYQDATGFHLKRPRLED
jgi:Asp-tRNA(Asn)/Glu-tRNA(Gln) amidotransferase A subunit family amidase